MKERLVGAAVLVAIGAWLIPWVLDGPEQMSEPASTTALDLPVPSTEELPVRTETVSLDRRETPAASPMPTPPAPEAAAPAVEADGATASSKPASTPAPVERPDAPAVEQSAADDSKWYVQIGAFGDQGNAERQAARVGTFGYAAHVSAFPAGSGVVHRVRIGPQSTRERAEAIASSLSAHGFVAQVVFE